MTVLHYVGAGTGEPALLPTRGLDLLRRAGVVLAEAPLPPALTSALRDDVVLLERGVGAAAVHRLPPGAGLLVRWVLGDPFARRDVLEEIRAAASEGLSFEVVPPLPAALAAAVHAGVPLVGDLLVGGDAGAGRSFQEEAGHRAAVVQDGGLLLLPLEARQLEEAAGALIRAGVGPGEPALAVFQPALPDQRAVSGTLEELPAAVRRTGSDGPCVLIVGRETGTRGPLAWFEKRPLLGRRIVVTRPREQAASLEARLAELGAVPVRAPMIRIAPPPEPGPLRAAAEDVERFDWIVFTSVNGVSRFWQALRGAGKDARALGGARLACIGPATAKALATQGVRADVVPAAYVAESLLEAMVAQGVAGARVLLPRAAGARSVLPAGLSSAGASVVEVEAYRAIPDEAGAAELRGLLEGGRLDAVTFTSSSTVERFVDAVGPGTGRAIVACIGPVTAATARALGLDPEIVAEEHTVEGLLEALTRWPGW